MGWRKTGYWEYMLKSEGSAVAEVTAGREVWRKIGKVGCLPKRDCHCGSLTHQKRPTATGKNRSFKLWNVGETNSAKIDPPAPVPAVSLEPFCFQTYY